MGRIIDSDVFYQQEWIRCGLYEPMVGVDTVDGTRETLYKTLRSRLIKAPEVDAVRVIRCENCVLWQKFDKKDDRCRCEHFSSSNDSSVYTKPDDFCSYAKRRYYFEK